VVLDELKKLLETSPDLVSAILDAFAHLEVDVVQMVCDGIVVYIVYAQQFNSYLFFIARS
jgi:hypothetical protein